MVQVLYPDPGAVYMHDGVYNVYISRLGRTAMVWIYRIDHSYTLSLRTVMDGKSGLAHEMTDKESLLIFQ